MGASSKSNPATPTRASLLSQKSQPLLRSFSEDIRSRLRGHVLGTGFGAAVPHFRPEQKPEHWSFRESCSFSSVMVVLASVVSIPLATIIHFQASLKHHRTLFLEDLSEAYVRLAVIPLACAAMNWFVQHLRRTCFWWENQKGGGTLHRQLGADVYSGSHSCESQGWDGADTYDDPALQRRGCFDPLSASLMFLVVLALLRDACSYALNEYAAESSRYYLSVIIAFVVLRLWFVVLDVMDSVIQDMVKDQKEINKCRPVKKMQGIVKNITRTGDEDKDMVYTFANSETVPAKVLSYVWWLYYIAANLFGGVIFLAVLLQEEQTVSRFMMGGLVLSTAASASLIFELGPNTISLLRLSLYKPFYVGDLITLNPTGALGSPATSIMGFVENITMMYVVIRNFEMKQTWISHDQFNKMIVQNWTRRPTKTVLLNIGMSSRCPLVRVERLTEFGKKWIKASPEIQQKNYQKCHITKTGNGYNLEIIFFPVIGVSHRSIRQKFLLAFMAAAERLKVPFVPLDIMNNFCEAPTSDGAWPTGDIPDSGQLGASDSFSDLMPDPHEVVLKDE